MATHFQAGTSSGSRCGETCSHSSSWRCWTACLRDSTTLTSSPPRNPSSQSRYAHDSYPSHLLPQCRPGSVCWTQRHLASGGPASLQSRLFIDFGQAWLGTASHKARRTCSEASCPGSSVSGQPQKHVTALVALLRMNGVLFR